MDKFIKLTEQRNERTVEERYFNVANIVLVYTNWVNKTIVQTSDGYHHIVKEDLNTVLKVMGIKRE